MKIKAVYFDLDGTLTEPYLDFDQIRREMGGVEGPILEAMEKMDAERRREVEAILLRHEHEAAVESRLNPGAWETLEYLRGERVRIGLITRNQRKSVEHVCRKHNMSFDAVITREDGPAKPDPYAVLKLCEMLEVEPGESVMVGDYLFDLLSGKRAADIE